MIYLTILTILNTLLIIYLILSKNTKIYFSFGKNKTIFENTLIGYEIILWKRLSNYSSTGILVLRIPIKNKRKTELKEEIERLLKGNKQNIIQTLHAKFSWLKTWEEVDQFKKDYLIVDKELVEKLILNFKEKNEK